MNKLPKSETLNEKRTAAVLRRADPTISVIEAAAVLQMRAKEAAKWLARWTENGRLLRIKRGLYLPVPHGSSLAKMRPADPWVVAEKLYRPCYIGALNAAKHWGMTDKDPGGLTVFTVRNPKNKHPVIKGTQFSIHAVARETMFGFLPVLRGKKKIFVSDPSRTIITFLADPALGGGINNIISMWTKYLASPHKNVRLLFSYAKRTRKGSVLKRLGFLLERFEPSEVNTIAFCKMLMGSGYIRLDPEHGQDKLATSSGVWVSKETVKLIKENTGFSTWPARQSRKRKGKNNEKNP